MTASAWRGRDLGTRTVAYTERDAILYALAVGARADDLDLVYEERLRVLPTFVLTLAQWAPDALGRLGAFDIGTAVHGAQRLVVHRPPARAGDVTMRASVTEVWDKGSAAVFDVEVVGTGFVATWSLFAPGRGGFGGDRGPAAPVRPAGAAERRLNVDTHAGQSALYRLLGDRHPMHIDPAAARAAGVDRPFLHGLCTLAATTLELAPALGAHPADLVELRARFAAPVFPGERLDVSGWHGDGDGVCFEAAAGERTAISGGEVLFRPVRTPDGPPVHEENPDAGSFAARRGR